MQPAKPDQTGGGPWESVILAAPSLWPLALVEVAERVAADRDRHTRRIAEIDQRLLVLDTRLAGMGGGPASYEGQELAVERDELGTMRRATEAALAALDIALVPAEALKRRDRAEQRRRYVDATERQQRESTGHNIERLEAQGDHRQARIWRLELLRTREMIERSIN